MAPQYKTIIVSPRGKGDDNPFVDTGLTVANTQRLSIAASGKVHLYTPGGTWAMKWVGPDGCGSYGPSGDCKLLSDTHEYPAARLLGRIGGTTSRLNNTNGVLFGIGRFYDQAAPASGKLELAVNDLDGYHHDNRGYFVVRIAIDAPGYPYHDGNCDSSHDTSSATINPIKLQSGDKLWRETDLQVETPAGTLAFTRFYTQSKQNHAEYQFMGLGWSHNHAYKLALAGTSPNRTAEVYLPEGGGLKLTESPSNAGHFDPQPGSTSVLDFDSTNGEYLLTLEDKGQMVFDGSTFHLKRRVQPSGEVWTYAYYQPTDGADLDGKLKQVSDDYGRFLQFAYIRDTDPNAFQRRMLYRVGDHTTTGLSDTTPTGRYVEFGYTPEKLNGMIVAGAQALLAGVQDVLGKVGTYEYYGQTSGGVQTDIEQLNLLLKRLSPAVDSTGDGVADASITLEALTYTDGSNALETTSLDINGDMENDSNWNSVNSPASNQRSTAQVDSGTYSRYGETTAVDQGFESDDWDLLAGRVYVITARVFPVAGKVKMQVKGTAIADESQAGSSAWETLRIIYSPTGEAEQRRIQFITSEMPESGHGQFYVDTVTVSRVKAIQQQRGDGSLITDLVFQADEANLTTETLVGKTTQHNFAHGVYLGPSNPVGEMSTHGTNDDYRLTSQTDPRGNLTQLDWEIGSQFLNGVTDAAGQDTAFGYDERDRLRASADALGRKTLYVYDAGNRQPTLVAVEAVTDLAVNGDMELDSDWTSIGSPTSNTQIPAPIAGHAMRHVVTSAAGQGIQNSGDGSSWDLEPGHTYTITARVYPVSGSVKMHASGTDALDQTTSDQGEWETLQVVYIPSTLISGNTLQFLASGGAAEFYVDSVAIFKSGVDAAVNGGMELDSDWTSIGSPTTNEQSDVQVDSGQYARHVVVNAAGQGIEGAAWDATGSEIYTVTARVYPVSGVVKMQVPGLTTADTEQISSGTGRWQTLQMFVQGPASGTKLRFVSAGATDEFYVDSVSILRAGSDLGVNGTMDFDNGWSSVGTPSVNKRVVGANSGQYARHVVTSAAGQGIEGNAWDLVANRTYIIQARVYAVSGTVKMQVSGTSAFDQTSTVPGIWQTLHAVYTPTVSVTDNHLQFVASGGASEFYVDHVSINETGSDLVVNGDMELDSDWSSVGSPTHYEQSDVQADSGQYARHVVTSAAGQGIEGNTWDLVANRTYLVMARVYTVSGTVKMQVSGTSAFDQTSRNLDTWETLRAIYAPTSGATDQHLQFVASGDAAEFYVDSVHIIEVSQLLNWQEFRYDSKGRVLMQAVLNPVNASLVQQTTRTYGTSGNGNGLLESMTQVDPLNAANNTSTTYTYDGAGRVIKTQQSSLFGSCQFSYSVYDEAGQVTATVCGQVNTIPPTTVEDAIALFDPADPDKYHVTTYVYDELGRRVQVTTNAGASFAQTSLTAYDSLGRTIRSIAHYVPDISLSNPYTAARTAFDHGEQDDQNLVSDTAYNARGLVRAQTDTLDNVTLYGYDDAGRLVKTIQSASQPTYNNDYTGPSPDPLLNDYVPASDADKDIITTQTYDAAGNLVKTTDALGTVSYTIYDALNRPVKTVRAAKDTATLDASVNDVGYTAAYDPSSDRYVPSDSPDRDQIETTRYDAMGRVVRTQRLLENRPIEQWETTLFGYDPLGRQIRLIRSASQPDYPFTSDPSLSGYIVSGSPDQDICSETAYDANGRVMYTEDALGARTWMAYDGLGRQIKTIANAVGTATDDSSDDPRSGSYSPSSDADKDLISTTTYDDDGRVESTEDVLGRVNRNVYDSRGRILRAVTNFIPQLDSEDREAYPQNWYWDDTAHLWKGVTKDGSGNILETITIDHGEDNDQNIIADTVYDAQGRVSQTFDNRHNAAYQVYDVLNRRVMSITNFIPQLDSEDREAYPQNWYWDDTAHLWKGATKDGSGNILETITIDAGENNDQNRITTITYDLAGRVARTRDAAGVETRYGYDALGRRTKTTVNYVDGTFNSISPDEDLISTIAYNKVGQVVSTTDVRGTQTVFAYDKVGRRLRLAQAANTPRSSVSYTCYDKAGRVLRTIQNWIDDGTSPDAKTVGEWDFVPADYGAYNDRNLVTLFDYDAVSRRVQTTDPLGSFTQTSYFKDGQVESLSDPKGVVTHYRYDGLRRRIRVVQSYVKQGMTDPQDWTWVSASKDWEYQSGSLVAHGADNDQNIIVDVTYDKAGRTTELRSSAGDPSHPLDHHLTYTYDLLNRRLSLTNPLDQTWSTVYHDLTDGGTQTVMTYPGIAGTGTYDVQRDFDALGRLVGIAYDDPGVTPDVLFTYDNAGNRSAMTEYNDTDPIRITNFTYDAMRRLTGVDFDEDGDTAVEESVSYEYDSGGLCTKLTLPGSLEVIYTYDQRGQLVSLTDWDDQQTQFAYDLARRHIATVRANGFRSRYQYDAAGRLSRLRHLKGGKTFAHFAYQTDKRGNRTQALEVLANPTTTTDTTIAYNNKGLVVSGTWSEVSGFKETIEATAALKLIFLGDEATLTMGIGPDHGLYDVYIGGSLWQSFDGYAASAGQRDILIPTDVDSRVLDSEGPHLLEIRNRGEHNATASDTKVRFKQVVVADRTYDLQTIEYVYDNLARLLEARYNPGINTTTDDNDLLRRYQFTYDRAGNRTRQIAPFPSVNLTYTYNSINQITNAGFTYDNNGNLLSDDVNAYEWDRANRLSKVTPSNSNHMEQYFYNGMGGRVQQINTINGTPLPPENFVLDMTEPGLEKVIVWRPSNNNFVYGPRGVHFGSGLWYLEDGLGSVRMGITSSGQIYRTQNYAPYGELFLGPSSSYRHSFTGEWTDFLNYHINLRARNYMPRHGVFLSLDPFEGTPDRAMSLNGYSWVEGNMPNAVDPSGMIYESPTTWAICMPNFPISPNPYADLSFCDQWPHNDHPLVYRLCRKCRGVSSTPITYRAWSSEVSLRNRIETDPRWSCAGVTLNGSSCKTRVAEIFGWLWSNGGEIGKRAVAGFTNGLDYYFFPPIVSFESLGGGSLAQAGPHGFPHLIGNLGGLHPGLILDVSLETSPVDHVVAMYLVHEMEHFWNDSYYAGTTMGEVRAYLSGYLYLLEHGYDTAGIGNINAPTAQIGDFYCRKDLNLVPDPNGRTFSKAFFNLLRGSNPGRFGSSCGEEARLPDA